MCTPLGPVNPVQVEPSSVVDAPTTAPPFVGGGPTARQLLVPAQAMACTVAVEAGMWAPSLVQVEPVSGETPSSPVAAESLMPSEFGETVRHDPSPVQLTDS